MASLDWVLFEAALQDYEKQTSVGRCRLRLAPELLLRQVRYRRPSQTNTSF
jgi:hypothetical protein